MARYFAIAFAAGVLLVHVGSTAEASLPDVCDIVPEECEFILQANEVVLGTRARVQSDGSQLTAKLLRQPEGSWLSAYKWSVWRAMTIAKSLDTFAAMCKRGELILPPNQFSRFYREFGIVASPAGQFSPKGFREGSSVFQRLLPRQYYPANHRDLFRASLVQIRRLLLISGLEAHYDLRWRRVLYGRHAVPWGAEKSRHSCFGPMRTPTAT